jgi:hypothetical protein
MNLSTITEFSVGTEEKCVMITSVSVDIPTTNYPDATLVPQQVSQAYLVLVYHIQLFLIVI